MLGRVRGSRWIQVVGALMVSAFAFWLTVHRFPLADIFKVLKSADFSQFGPYIVLFVLIQLIRSWRWRLFLEPAAELEFSRVNAANAVGLLAVTILPMRIGEIVRPMLIATPPNLTTMRALPSIVMERMADGVFTAILLFIALLGLQDHSKGQAALRATGIAALLICAVLMGGLLLLNGKRAWIASLAGRMAGHLNSAWGAPAEQWTDSWVEAIRLPRSPARRMTLILLTAVYWSFASWSLQVLGWTVGLNITLPMACAVTGTITLGAVVPAGPGMAGTLQVGAILALSLFMPQQALLTKIAAFAHLLWATQLVLQVAWGLVFLPTIHIRQRIGSLGSNLFSRPGAGG